MDIPASLAHIGLSDDDKLHWFINKVVMLYSLVEGGYDAVNASDGAAMSIGILQWHGCRAKMLLQRLINSEEEKELLSGTQICEDLSKDADFWNHRIAYPHELSGLKALLSSPAGLQIQSDFAKEEISVYLLHGVELGITDLKALAYFCDLENQGGEYIAEEVVQTVFQEPPITLDSLCVASLMHPLMGVIRRRRRIYSYRKILEFFKEDR